MKANKFFISNLNDTTLISDIKQSIRSHDGINGVRVDMQAGNITVDYDEGRYTEGDIKGFVSQAGLNVIQVK